MTKRILIIDDDESIRRTLKLIFGTKGYETEAVGTGREAIEKAKANFFNVVFLDIKLPDIEGIELLAPLKELHPDMVVIMVTAYAALETAVRALNEGASAYITKPLNMDEVLAILREALEKQHLIEEKRQAEEKLKEYAENLEKMIEERTSELRESEARYRGLYESSIDGIVFLDLDGNIVACNQAFADMLGYTKEELCKLTSFELIPDKWHDRVTKITAQVLTRGYSEEYEIEYIKKDGTPLPVSIRKWLIKDKDGTPTGRWAIVRDITDRYRLMEMKERFISVATHELRTPLVSIKGYVDFLLSEDLESAVNLIEPSLEVVKRNTDRLLHLTDDLLDIQRIKSERLPLEFESLNLIELINHCTEEIQPFLNEKKHIFHLEVPEGPLLIQGDHIRLSQAIMNLLNNATKFTPEGGDITLSVEEKEDNIQIQVSDTGIGIRKEDLERVFQPFADIKKPNHIKGTGLGLSVTRGLVKAHGGNIWAHSDGEGKGATFIIILPKRNVKKEVS